MPTVPANRRAAAIFSATVLLGGASSCALPPRDSGSPQSQSAGTSRPVGTVDASAACVAPSRYLFGPDRVPDYSSDALFTISELSGDSAGGVLVRFDADTPQPGSDERDSSGIAEVLPDGSVRFLDEIAVGARTSSPNNLYPLGAAPGGGQYLFDRSSQGIIVRDVDDEWSQVATLPDGSVLKAPSLALAADGSTYIATASQVLLLADDGSLQVVAGKFSRASDILFPQTPLVGLPVPALEADLPSPNALIIDDKGDIFIATPDSIFSISGGVLQVVHVVGTTVLPPPEAVNAPNITGLAINEDGSMIVSDSANEMVYSIQGDETELMATNTRFISDGSVLSRPDSAPLLRVDGEQQAVCTA